jgi:hypothetical protein
MERGDARPSLRAITAINLVGSRVRKRASATEEPVHGRPRARRTGLPTDQFCREARSIRCPTERMRRHYGQGQFRHLDVCFITGPNEGAGNPLGDDGGRLHDWMFDAKTDADAEVVEEVYATTGAILMGKRMFDVGVEPWGDPPPFRMPVFVLTHSRPDRPRWCRRHRLAGHCSAGWGRRVPLCARS